MDSLRHRSRTDVVMKPIKYLLVTHLPAARGDKEGTIRVGDLWLQDLQTQAAAAREAGLELIVATPCVSNLDDGATGSFHTVEIRPQDHGFEYIPIPGYNSLKGYLKVRGELRSALSPAVARA